MISPTTTTEPAAAPRLRMPAGTSGPVALVVTGRGARWSGGVCDDAVRIAVSPVTKGVVPGVRAWSPPV